MHGRKRGEALTRERIRRFVLSLSLIVLLEAAAPGSRAPSSQLKLLDLNGRQIDPLSKTDARATVFVFLRSDCPISNRYAPEVRRLAQQFAPSGITFWLVYPDPDESIETIRRHLKEYDYRLPALRDANQTLTRKAGVLVTPEAAVFSSGSQLVYRGRIDDRFIDFGKARPAPTTRDLEEVLEAIIAGKPVVSRTTSAVGCSIPPSR